MAEQLSLAQAFQNRPGRFRLLKKGIERTGWKSSSVRLLEAGCSVGDAAAMLSVEMGFDVTAFDHEPALVSEAIRIHGTGSRLHFDAADASALPYPEASFEGLYSEAAFSPMIDKSGALAEYRRVLKPGSLVLINDFVIRKDAEDAVREEVVQPHFQHFNNGQHTTYRRVSLSIENLIHRLPAHAYTATEFCFTNLFSPSDLRSRSCQSSFCFIVVCFI